MRWLTVPALSALLALGVCPGLATAEPLIRGRTIARNSTPRPIDQPAAVARVRDILKLSYPFHLRLLNNGGCEGSAVDSLGRTICFKLDTRTVQVGPDGVVPRRLMTLGCRGDSADAPRELPAGCDEEAALITAFHLYLDTFVLESQRDSLVTTPHYYWYRLSPEQNTARVLLGTARFLETQARAAAAGSSPGAGPDSVRADPHPHH